MLKDSNQIAFYAIIIALLLTPNMPMPTGELGPIAPAMYLLVFGLFILFMKKRLPETLMNGYFKVLVVLQVCLVVSDILRIILFGIESEMFYVPIRIVNGCIVILFAYYFVEKDDASGLYGINPFFLKVYIATVLIVSVILYGQAFQIFTFGMINNGRTFFGIQLPIMKPVGLFDASDGKLGIMVGPLLFLYLANCYKKTKFVKVRWAPLLVIIFGLLIIVLQSRSGYLALAIAGLVFLLLHPGTINKITIVGGLFFSGFLMLFTDIFSKINAGLVGEGIYEQNVEGRGDGLTEALGKFIRSPIWGVGHDAARHNRGYLNTEEGNITHNLFLDHLTSGGLLTGLPIILMFLLYFYVSFKLYNIAREQKNYAMIGMSCWLICSMVYIFIELNFYRGLYNEFMYMYFSFGVLAYLNYHILRREKNIAYS